MQAAGQLEMAVPDGARSLEHAQQFFVLQHMAHRQKRRSSLPLTPVSVEWSAD
jgi:hypothetical protein